MPHFYTIFSPKKFQRTDGGSIEPDELLPSFEMSRYAARKTADLTAKLFH